VAKDIRHVHPLMCLVCSLIHSAVVDVNVSMSLGSVCRLFTRSMSTHSAWCLAGALGAPRFGCQDTHELSNVQLSYKPSSQTCSLRVICRLITSQISTSNPLTTFTPLTLLSPLNPLAHGSFFSKCGK
jgi:hypothetical protein